MTVTYNSDVVMNGNPISPPLKYNGTDIYRLQSNGIDKIHKFNNYTSYINIALYLQLDVIWEHTRRRLYKLTEIDGTSHVYTTINITGVPCELISTNYITVTPLSHRLVSSLDIGSNYSFSWSDKSNGINQVYPELYMYYINSYNYQMDIQYKLADNLYSVSRNLQNSSGDKVEIFNTSTPDHEYTILLTNITIPVTASIQEY